MLGDLRAELSQLARVATLVSRCRWDRAEELDLRLPLLAEAMRYISEQYVSNLEWREQQLVECIAARRPRLRTELHRVHLAKVEFRTQARELSAALECVASKPPRAQVRGKLARQLGEFAVACRSEVEAKEALICCLELPQPSADRSAEPSMALRTTYPRLATYLSTGEGNIFVRHGTPVPGSWAATADEWWCFLWNESAVIARSWLEWSVPSHLKRWLRTSFDSPSEGEGTNAVLARSEPRGSAIQVIGEQHKPLAAQRKDRVSTKKKRNKPTII
jgi:hypothetical protein